MPLPERYRKPVDDFYAGKLSGRDLREIVERIDNIQMSLNFVVSSECEYRPTLAPRTAIARKVWGSEPSHN